jgi:hypothetical protein
MEERTHISASSVQFVNDLIKEVCLNGKSLSKFRSEISRNFPDDENIYGEIEEFVDTVKSVSKGDKEIDAAFLELRTAAQHIFLTSDTVNAVVEPLKSMVKRPEFKMPEEAGVNAPAPKDNAPQPAKSGSKKNFYIVLIIIILLILAVLYFNSK